MHETSDAGALVGRILMALIFVLSGFGKIVGFAGTAQMMAAQGVPAVQVLLIVSILIELGGGLCLMVGFQTRWAALIIFLFMIPVTWIFHVQGYVLAMHQGNMLMAMMQKINILKNISIEGGLVILASFGPGRFSVDGRRLDDLPLGHHDDHR